MGQTLLNIQKRNMKLFSIALLAASAQATELGDKIKNDWYKKYDKCGWGEEDDHDDDEDEREANRANMDDPCQASHQLTRSLARVAKKHLQPCGDNEGSEPKFANRISNKANNLRKKMSRKARCPKVADDEEEE